MGDAHSVPFYFAKPPSQQKTRLALRNYGLAGHPNRGKLARLLDPDEVTERDFWQIVGEARSCVEGGMDLD